MTEQRDMQAGDDFARERVVIFQQFAHGAHQRLSFEVKEFHAGIVCDQYRQPFREAAHLEQAFPDGCPMSVVQGDSAGQAAADCFRQLGSLDDLLERTVSTICWSEQAAPK